MTGAALQGLHTAVLGRRAIYLEETDSTNRYLKEAGESLPHGTLCYTGRPDQRPRPGWAGTGRHLMGRPWPCPCCFAGRRTPIGAAAAGMRHRRGRALDRLAGERAGCLSG